MRSAKTFHDLPEELLVRIADFADSTTLLALRLQCRATERSSLAAFTRKHFHVLDFHLNEISLRSAINVAKHPTFGSAIKSIRICVDQVDEIGRYAGNQFPGPRDLWAELLCSRNDVVEVIETQKRMRDLGTDLHLLVFLFCQLKHMGHVGTLRMIDSCRRKDNRAIISHGAPQLEIGRSFGVVMEALSLSGLKINKFSIRGREWALPVHARPGPVRSFLPQFGITRLDLVVWHVVSTDGTNAEEFARSIAALPNLTELSIKNTKSCEDKSFRDRMMDEDLVVEHILEQQYPSLRKLTVATEEIWFSDITDFLHEHPKGHRVKHLQARCVKLFQNDGTSMPVTTLSAKNPNALLAAAFPDVKAVICYYEESPHPDEKS